MMTQVDTEIIFVYIVSPYLAMLFFEFYNKEYT